MILEKSDLEVIIKSLGKNGYVNLAGALTLHTTKVVGFLF